MTDRSAIVSSLTDRYQTTIPQPVRLALNLGKRDRIEYTILADGTVQMTREAEAEGDDPVLAPFLDLLARDLRDHPERLRQLDADFVARIEALVGDVEVDLDAPLPEEDDNK